MLSAAKKPVRNRGRKNGCVFILSCLYPDTEKERSEGALSSRVCCSNVCSCISQTKKLIRLITAYHQWSQLHLSMGRLNWLSTSPSLVVLGGKSVYGGAGFAVFVNKQPREEVKEHRRKHLPTEAPVDSECVGEIRHPSLVRAADKAAGQVPGTAFEGCPSA